MRYVNLISLLPVFWQLGNFSVQHDQLWAIVKPAIICYEDVHHHLPAVELSYAADAA